MRAARPLAVAAQMGPSRSIGGCDGLTSTGRPVSAAEGGGRWAVGGGRSVDGKGARTALGELAVVLV